jgi:plasmid maintenance system antidote protein VapI
MINGQVNFKDLLKQELHQRMTKNPMYSIRSFAKALRIHPGTLSSYLNGKRKITIKSAAYLAERLNLDPLRLNLRAYPKIFNDLI